MDSDYDGLAAAVKEEVAHRETHGAQQRESAELPFVIGKAIDDGSVIRRSARSPANECSDRSSDPGNSMNPAGDFTYVYSWVSRCACHQESSLSNVAFIGLFRTRLSPGLAEQLFDLFEPFGIDAIAAARVSSCAL